MDSREVENQGRWKVVLFLTLGFLILWYFLSALHPLHSINQDLGRFLAISDGVFSSLSTLSVNTYSYTHPVFEFINSHWFGGVVLGFLFSTFGPVGLIIIKSLILTVSLCLVIRLVYIRTDRNIYGLLITALALIPGIYILLERTHARPELLSYLFFVLFLYILETKHRYFIYILPALSLVWINTHIYFILGFFLVGVYFLDELWNNRWSKKAQQLFFIGLSCVVVSLVNPFGFDALLYPLRVLSNYGYSIVENQTLFFLIPFSYHLERIAVIFLWIAVLIISFLVVGKRTRVSDFLLSLGCIYLGLSAVRHVPILILGTLPVLVVHIYDVYLQYSNKPLVFSRRAQVLSVGALFVAVVLVGNATPSVSVAYQENYRGAVDFIIENDIEGNMFNNFDIGGYLIYTLSPERPVFVDNRPEAYPADFFQKDYIPMQEDVFVWNEKAEAYDISYIVFGIQDVTPWAQSFLGFIIRHDDWSVVYLDEFSIVLLRSSVEDYADIIERHEIPIQ